ncbi:hypothetical protein GVAV_000659 [Gurleya vavrai]
MPQKKQLEQSTRVNIISKYENGKNPKIISEKLDLNINTVSSVIGLYKKTGRIYAIKKREPKLRKLYEDGEEFISREIENNFRFLLNTLRQNLE